VRYHHLLDPQTGKPARNGLESVTVVCDSAERADILSTALFVMGEEKALEFWKRDGNFEMILIREDKTIVITEPLRAQFTEQAGSGYKIQLAK
jgi:thiamine biosynthesis lipoprotein